jgi:hypothetical protein
MLNYGVFSIYYDMNSGISEYFNIFLHFLNLKILFYSKSDFSIILFLSSLNFRIKA